MFYYSFILFGVVIRLVYTKILNFLTLKCVKLKKKQFIFFTKSATRIKEVGNKLALIVKDKRESNTGILFLDIFLSLVIYLNILKQFFSKKKD